VEQYRQLGIPRFSELYVRGFLNIYTQAVSEGKRAANSLVVGSVLLAGVRGGTNEPSLTEPLPANGTQWVRVAMGSPVRQSTANHQDGGT
jgi:hypothetical protein